MHRAFVDGDPVEVLNIEGDEATVKFLEDGSIEPVKKDDIEYR